MPFLLSSCELIVDVGKLVNVLFSFDFNFCFFPEPAPVTKRKAAKSFFYCSFIYRCFWDENLVSVAVWLSLGLKALDGGGVAPSGSGVA